MYPPEENEDSDMNNPFTIKRYPATEDRIDGHWRKSFLSKIPTILINMMESTRLRKYCPQIIG